MNATPFALPGPFTPRRPRLAGAADLSAWTESRRQRLWGAARARVQARPATIGAPWRLLLLVGWLVLAMPLVSGGALLATHSGRVAVKTLLVVPELLPDTPVQPLLWVTPPPRHEEHGYDTAVGRVEFDVYLPRTDGKHSAIVLYTGAFGLRHDPSFVRAAEALARSGAVVMVPESSALRSGEILPAEVDALRQALAYLRGRPDVDPARIGVFGFSAGGSLVLLAAEDEVVREQIAFLNIFGAYYDAEELLLAVASHEIDADGGPRPWHPSDVTAYTFAKQIIGALPDARDRDILGRAYLARQTETQAELDALSPDGQLVRELFERPTRDRAAAILAALPQSCRDGLAAISPRNRIDRLQARLYLMHGRKDGHIPVTQARSLAAAAPPGTVQQYTELDLFVHVTPDPTLDRLTIACELLRLSYHAWLVGHEYL